MKVSKSNTISEIVTLDFRTASIFKKFGLDFCCNGNRTIEAACQEVGIEPVELITAIERIAANNSIPGMDYSSWPVDLLVDYIEKSIIVM